MGELITTPWLGTVAAGVPMDAAMRAAPKAAVATVGAVIPAEVTVEAAEVVVEAAEAA